MSVYVDDLQATIKSKQWPYSYGCHLVADTTEELLKFVQLIGLKTIWFQNKQGGIPHFDLTSGMRQKAIKFGAIEINRSQVVKMLWKARAKDGNITSKNSQLP